MLTHLHLRVLRHVPIGALQEIGIPAHKQFYIELPEDKAGVEVTWTVQVPQNGFGGGGEPTALKLGVRSGEPVEFSYGPTSIKADHVIQPESSNGLQRATFGSSCFTDGKPLQEHN